VIDEGDLIAPLCSGTIKPNDRILSFIRSSVIMVNADETLNKLSDLFAKGYVALVKDSQQRLRIITKIDFISYLGTRLK
jgi:predicted transcriptional regulator